MLAMIATLEAETLGTSLIRAEWAPIRICHDVFTGETLNIGVALKGPSGAMYARVINDVGRLGCLYGEDEASSILLAAKMSEEAFLHGKISGFSPNIALGDFLPVSGLELAQIAEQLFQQIVSVARPQRIQKDKAIATEGLSRADLHVEVFNAMRRMSGLTAEKIIAQNANLKVPHGDGHRIIDIPLQSDRLMGALESAWFRDKKTLELKLLNAALDVETAASRFRAGMGFFVARPMEGFLTESQLMLSDNVIDTISWKLRAQGAHFEVEGDPEKLAEKILEWAA